MNSKSSLLRSGLLGLLLAVGVLPAFSQAGAAAGIKSSIVPERYLRGYDPVTVFYDKAVGPDKARPADGPGEWLRIKPEVPGEYRWLDARTIQFLPAVAWPALREYSVVAKDRTVGLTTLMIPPSSISPGAGSRNLDPIGSFTLSFPTVLSIDALARMVRIEVRDLPGLDGSGARWIGAADFTIRELEGAKSSSHSSFRISLREPVTYGKRAILHLKLSTDETIEGTMVKYTFDTQPQFRLTAMGGNQTQFPVSPNGAAYNADQAIDCGTGGAPLWLQFSDDIKGISVETLKRLVRFEPAVRNLRHEVSGSRLMLYFDADRDRQYHLRVNWQDLRSDQGRVLSRFSESGFWFFYRQSTPFLQWKTGQGIAERYGPQVLPMEGRGMARIDLRVNRIDPENLDFWPFPAEPILINENSRPPMPGEEPAKGTEIAKQIRLLGSPEVSRIFALPIDESSPRSYFGLDLKASLAATFGKDQPGTYLVGYRVLDKSDERRYVRLTVTDLCLGTVEEEDGVCFLVTSLKTGQPVPGVSLRIDAWRDRGEGRELVPALNGTTDATGLFHYRHLKAWDTAPYRLVARLGNDVLVLDANNPPPVFANNHWSRGDDNWLSWLANDPRETKHDSRRHAWLLTERPIYRPDEAVHIIGWVRERQDGRIIAYKGEPLELVVSAGEKEWIYPVDANGNGRYYKEFKEPDPITGEYRAELRGRKSGTVLASASFRKESYRVPLFEVNLTGPDRVALDQPFGITLTADFYSGGRMVGENVRWEISQYPYSVSVPQYEGYLFSTDARFSGGEVFNPEGASSSEDVLDDNGSSTLTIDPSTESDGRARRYVIEATVQGADRQTVTQVKQVISLPAFSIGLKLPRYNDGSTAIKPSVIVLDHLEQPRSGVPLTVRLYQRQWHSYIAETDFTTGEVKYITDVVDKQLSEIALRSTGEVMVPSFPIKEAGVYLVEVAATDSLGRRITVKADTFVAGQSPVSWDRTKAGLFELSPDRSSYKPGQIAQVLIKSPYQDGYALVVAEKPEANEYTWVPIKNGQGVFKLAITETMCPGLPLMVLLERGRGGDFQAAVSAATGLLRSRIDLAKPAALGASTMLKVQSVANQLNLALEHDAKKAPGTSFTMKIRLSDPDGKQRDGEVALWLVDKAVLSLGVEAPLDPLSHFIDPVLSWLRLRDSRNLTIGAVPLDEIPGGDGMDEFARSELFNKTTVRKNFKTVPYFNPAIPVKDGKAEVEIQLPDNLTDFAIRAVAVSGYDRFGTARSVLSVRMPVIVQSALPRFVRPGDDLVTGGIGRVVEGDGGPALVGVSVTGFTYGPDAGTPVAGLPGQVTRTVRLDQKKAQKLLFPLMVPMELIEKPGAKVSFSLFIQRLADKARDAFELELPLRDDAPDKRLAKQEAVESAQAVLTPYPAEAFRPGSLERTVVVTRDLRLLRIMNGLQYLESYTHGCLEQRTSKLYPAVLLKDLGAILGLSGHLSLADPVVKDYLSYLASCQDEDGLFAYWPGSTGYVALTAYVMECLAAMKDAGIAIDRAAFDRGGQALRQALRSDYSRLVSGWSSYERVEALAALERSGYWDEAYASELLAQSAGLPAYSQARLLIALANRKLQNTTRAQDLAARLEAMVVTKKEGAREIFGGLQDKASVWGGPVLSTELKTIAAMIEALGKVKPASPRLALLNDYLLTRGGADGWGNTQDNVVAIRALRNQIASAASGAAPIEIEVGSGGKKRTLPASNRPVAVYTLAETGPLTLSVSKGTKAGAPVYLIMTTAYKPAARGSDIQPSNNGFSVNREFITIGADNQPSAKVPAAAGQKLELALDTVVEEHVTVITFENRDFVAVTVPLAAGLEPLNPTLANAPKEARPQGGLTRAPSYVMYLDDKVVFYYNNLPKGSYDFYFRTRANFSGNFSAPPAWAELMYDLGIRGNSFGMGVSIARDGGED